MTYNNKFAVFMMFLLSTSCISADFFKKLGHDIEKKFVKGQNLDRIKIKNITGKDMYCEIVWKNRHGGNLLTKHQTVKKGEIGEPKAPLLGYGIYKLSVTDGKTQKQFMDLAGKADSNKAHGNDFFVLANDPSACHKYDIAKSAIGKTYKKETCVTITGYANEQAYNESMKRNA